MSRDQAMVEAKRLKSLLEKHGVKASIELQVGRANRTGWGDDWYSRKVGIMNHHTAGSARGLTPSLSVVKNGRPRLPGPLCNGFGGRDLVYRIITMGLANHPGQGGPMTLDGYRIPKDSARHVLWGTEWEHDGRSPWTSEMREFMGRANNALLEWMARPVSVSIEHKTWAGSRKPDRYRYDAADGQAEIRAWTPKPAPKPAPKPEEDDLMAMSEADRKKLIDDIGAECAERVWSTPFNDPAFYDPKTKRYGRQQTAAVRLNYANHAIYQVLKKMGDLAKLVAAEGMSQAERQAQVDKILAGVKDMLENDEPDPAPPSPGN